ncbi:hypothetical protein [Pseudomonas graminis]|uniref:hypothetical protein n=1 Tax=Pseudomonas graminis TaxID=158627 RepID=UPI0009F5CB9F|nr:hypothetical protein [Pseudomonas graminis]
MISVPRDLPDDPALLKELFEHMLLERETSKGLSIHPEEENARCFIGVCHELASTASRSASTSGGVANN